VAAFGVNHYGYELGDVTFTGDTAHEFRVKWLAFDHWLKTRPIRIRRRC
jgi:hypothetical protein